MSTDKIEKSRDELTDKEMDKVSGGGASTPTTKGPSISEISITKKTDAASND
jgi:bacteriocin-like protein